MMERKHYWWMIALIIIAAFLLITDFDPVGDMVGEENVKLIIVSILSIFLVWSLFFYKPKG